MPEDAQASESIKARVESEFKHYIFVSAYLFICFFVLMTYEASLTQNPREALFASLGMILGKALVVGKFILIGDALGAGNKVRAPTLVHRVAWRTLSMTIVLVVLTLLENLILGWVHGERGGELINNLMDQTWVSFIAHVMLMLLILIPLITATEVVRALGTDGLNRLIQERQHRSAWTFEIELRAYSDRPYWNH